MATVRLTAEASEQLERLIVTHTLPADTRHRVAKALRALEQFPKAGRALSSSIDSDRFVIGPWRWILLIYEHLEPEDLVNVFSIQDARSATPIA